MGMELDVGHPLALARGEGERITDRDARFVALLVDRPEVTVTLSRYDEGEEGPRPHLHRQHADSFAILAGAMRYEVAGEPRELGAGELARGAAAARPHLPQRPAGVGWWLNFHTPDAGFAAMMRARRDGVEPDRPGTPSRRSRTRACRCRRRSSAARGSRASGWRWSGSRSGRASASSGASRAGSTCSRSSTGGGRFAALAIEAELDLHAVAAAPAGTPWRFTRRDRQHGARRVDSLALGAAAMEDLRAWRSRRPRAASPVRGGRGGSAHTPRRRDDGSDVRLAVAEAAGRRRSPAVTATTMVFKLEGDDHAQALALPGAQLFDPMGGRPMKAWVQVPAAQVGRSGTTSQSGRTSASPPSSASTA